MVGSDMSRVTIVNVNDALVSLWKVDLLQVGDKGRGS